MNNTILDVYSDTLTDDEMESLFNTPKENRKGSRRKTDYKKAKRKARIDLARSCDNLPYFLTKQEKNRHNEMLVELQELEEDMLMETGKEIA